MMKIVLSLLSLVLVFSVFTPAALAQGEADTAVCDEGTGYITSGAGIMNNVTCVCLNEGNCQLSDVLQVFVNVADYILGVVGSLALILFVIGGFYFLVSQGESGKVAKGKKYMTGAVVGLLIVFFAYIGVQSLETVLKTGQLAGVEGYEVCDGNNDGASCAYNSQCYFGSCHSICAASNDLNSSCFGAEDTSASLLSCSSGEGICPEDGEDVCCVVFDESDTN